jgi:hypothetical protein
MAHFRSRHPERAQVVGGPCVLFVIAIRTSAGVGLPHPVRLVFSCALIYVPFLLPLSLSRLAAVVAVPSRVSSNAYMFCCLQLRPPPAPSSWSQPSSAVCLRLDVAGPRNSAFVSVPSLMFAGIAGHGAGGGGLETCGIIRPVATAGVIYLPSVRVFGVFSGNTSGTPDEQTPAIARDRVLIVPTSSAKVID